MTLQEYRVHRMIKGLFSSAFFMIGVAFLTKGLFFTATAEPLWQKFVKLLCCTVAIVITSILSVIKEYEKGAFGVPNDIEEINEVWQEFQKWTVPNWIIQEVIKLNEREVKYEEKERQDSVNRGTNLQEKQEAVEQIPSSSTDSILYIACDNNSLCGSDT